MNIKILGSGCKNCVNLEKATLAAVAELGLDSSVEKVTDYPTIASYGIMSTPGLVVDGEVLVYGRVPRPEEIKQLLTDARA